MRVLILPITLILLLPVPASSSTWHVPSEAATIQAGVDSAAAGDTVLVAPGTYTGDGNRDADFGGKDLVLMSGGGAAATVIDCEGSESDPHRGLLFHFGETSASEVRGMSIVGGWDSGSGGAVKCAGSSPMFVDCVFEQNYAPYGGAVSCMSSASTFTGCVFNENSAGEGSGCYSYDSDITVTACIFGGNASDTGGALYVILGSASIADCLFSLNDSGGNGGGAGSWGATIEYSSCVFLRNRSYRGGGVYCRLGPAVNFDGCTFWENNSWRGGGLYCIDNSPLITDCTFAGNESDDGGGIFCWNSSPTIRSTIVAHSRTGHSIYVNSGLPLLECCDIFGNAGGDWVGVIADQQATDGNFSEDPIFCNLHTGDLTLAENSPCIAPQLDPDCGERIGALGMGCAATSLSSGDFVPSTWGVVKDVFQFPGN